MKIMAEQIDITPTKIVAIGDSITYGFPYSPRLSWVSLMAKQLQIDCDNKGVCGDTTYGMLERFSADVLKQQPSHVIIMGGTNDVFAGMGLKDILGNIQAMIHLSLTNSIVPIIGLPIPCTSIDIEDRLSQLRGEILSYAHKNRIGCIDFRLVMAGPEGTNIMTGLNCDGLHPSEEGYRRMAAAAVAYFKKRCSM